MCFIDIPRYDRKNHGISSIYFYGNMQYSNFDIHYLFYKKTDRKNKNYTRTQLYKEALTRKNQYYRDRGSTDDHRKYKKRYLHDQRRDHYLTRKDSMRK